MFSTERPRAKVPRFTSPDKGLEGALNALGNAINAIQLPNINLVGGTQEWSGSSVLLRPDATPLVGSPPVYIPWKPTFSLQSGQNKVRFNLGTVNGLIATNWDELLDLAPAETVFVVLTATGEAGTGSVTGFSLSLEPSPPAQDNPTEGVLPSEFKFVLGVIKDHCAQMVIDYNLNATGSTAFIKSQTAPVEGGETFVRYWKWLVNRDQGALDPYYGY